MVDVPADDAVGAGPPRDIAERGLEFRDELDGVFDPELQEGRERPIGVAKGHPRFVKPAIEPEGDAIGLVAHKGQPFGVADHHVELVAMDDQQAASIGCPMQCLMLHFDTGEAVVDEGPAEFVVISRDEDHPAAFLDTIQEQLQERVM